MFKRLRIAILLTVLAVVALQTWRSQARTTSWKETLHVAIYPMNLGNSEAMGNYIASLREEHFDAIEAFFAAELSRHGLTLDRAVDVSLGPAVSVPPPALSARPGMLESMSWSLRMRWWAWRHTPKTALPPDIRLYVNYLDPDTHETAPHSRGLQKGQIGLIHGFGTRRMHGPTSVVIVHELLHTLGATDKYDLATGLPQWPAGYAIPYAEPRYPQEFAEIMGGRIPLSANRAEMPRGLLETMVGEQTAHEIGWRKMP